MKKIIALLVLMIASLSMTSYALDVTVERPSYSSGDYWIFTDGKGKGGRLEFLREEKDRYVFKRGGKEIVRDFSLMDVNRSGGFPGPIIRFPLKKGAWWNYEFTAPSATGSARGEIIARYEVTDYDKITVPAGTFQAFKITVNIESIYRGGGGARAKAVGSATYWYAPDVKQVIKAERGEQSWELKEYKIK